MYRNDHVIISFQHFCVRRRAMESCWWRRSPLHAGTAFAHKEGLIHPRSAAHPAVQPGHDASRQCRKKGHTQLSNLVVATAAAAKKTFVILTKWPLCIGYVVCTVSYVGHHSIAQWDKSIIIRRCCYVVTLFVLSTVHESTCTLLNLFNVISQR